MSSFASFPLHLTLMTTLGTTNLPYQWNHANQMLHSPLRPCWDPPRADLAFIHRLIRLRSSSQISNVVYAIFSTRRTGSETWCPKVWLTLCANGSIKGLIKKFFKLLLLRKESRRRRKGRRMRTQTASLMSEYARTGKICLIDKPCSAILFKRAIKSM